VADRLLATGCCASSASARDDLDVQARLPLPPCALAWPIVRGQPAVRPS